MREQQASLEARLGDAAARLKQAEQERGEAAQQASAQLSQTQVCGMKFQRCPVLQSF